MIEPYYYKGKLGNKPYDLELMLRIYMLQNLYDLFDIATIAEVIDSRVFSEFCGVDSSNQVPDVDTLGIFRHILEDQGIHQELFAQVAMRLMEKKLILKKETIAASMIIAAPTSTKNQKKECDPYAHQVKKGNTWHLRYKAHIGLDKDSGLVQSVEVTGANVHDVTMASKLLTSEEETVNGDSGYLGAEKCEDAVLRNHNGKKIKYKINLRPSQSKKNSARSKAQIKRREHEKSSVRAKVEHVFGIVKGLIHYRKIRYWGLRKQTAKLNMMFELENLILADRPCLVV